jgi:class 3 adenylate cyclase/pimeloyl-ACP methyl ester carboxylesterase
MLTIADLDGQVAPAGFDRVRWIETQGLPETRYVANGNTHLAYQTLGDGPVDILGLAGFCTHCEHQWEDPSMARCLRRTAAIGRLVCFDRRGTGMSDPVARDELPTLADQVDDIRAVLDEIGSRRVVLFGADVAGPACIAFAVTYPQRTAGLVLFGTWAKLFRAPDYPWGVDPEAIEPTLAMAEQGWGKGLVFPTIAPSAASDTRLQQWWARWERLAASPGTAAALLRTMFVGDVRSLLPTVRVPTLVLHRTSDMFAPVELGRYLATSIPRAEFVELPGSDHLHFVGDSMAVVDEIEAFVTGVRPVPDADRVLATVLFTDIVGSTQLVAEVGDRRWRDMLDAHDVTVRRLIGRFRGHEIDHAGDGFFVRFDSPAQAIRCAKAISLGVAPLGLEVRAGVHTGECELRAGGLGGIAVHIGARIAALARAGEILVSSTVKELVTGSELAFEDRGRHALKGVAHPVRVFGA